MDRTSAQVLAKLSLLRSHYFFQIDLWSKFDRCRPEAEFLDVIGTKVLKEFPPCYTCAQSPLLMDFTPPALPLHPSKSGLKLVYMKKLCIRKPLRTPQLSRLWTGTSTKLYVHEIGFRSNIFLGTGRGELERKTR
jgi:hypothetical protein